MAFPITDEPFPQSGTMTHSNPGGLTNGCDNSAVYGAAWIILQIIVMDTSRQHKLQSH